MKKFILLISFPLVLTTAVAQSHEPEKEAIYQVIEKFRASISKKDSSLFLSLFYDGPVSWVGVLKNRSQTKRLETNRTKTRNYFVEDYRKFIVSLSTNTNQEIFENIHVINDDVTASVSFEYTFWENNKMENYGKEFWLLIKAEGKWKISSVVYSVELSL